MRAHLRRQLKVAETGASPQAQHQASAFQELLDWVLAREKRYDKKAGGL